MSESPSSILLVHFPEIICRRCFEIARCRGLEAIVVIKEFRRLKKEWRPLALGDQSQVDHYLR